MESKAKNLNSMEWLIHGMMYILLNSRFDPIVNAHDAQHAASGPSGELGELLRQKVIGLLGYYRVILGLVRVV